MVATDSNEAPTLSLVERFREGIFPSPSQFTDEEIDCIESWAGEDDDNTFSDRNIIDEYGIDASSGENTWSRFAAMLRTRKAAWESAQQAHTKNRNKATSEGNTK